MFPVAAVHSLTLLEGLRVLVKLQMSHTETHPAVHTDLISEQSEQEGPSGTRDIIATNREHLGSDVELKPSSGPQVVVQGQVASLLPSSLDCDPYHLL